MGLKLAALFGIALVVVGAAVAMSPGMAARAAQEIEPAVFSSPVNGGCYIAAPGQCRLHIDPYTVNVGTGRRLEAIRVQANGVTVYDFKTDVSNPPPFSGTTYTISPVALDFAAECGKTYTINVLGKDSGDANFLNMGQTAAFTCPSTVP